MLLKTFYKDQEIEIVNSWPGTIKILQESWAILKRPILAIILKTKEEVNLKLHDIIVEDMTPPYWENYI